MSSENTSHDFKVVAEESQLLLLKCNSPLCQVVLTHGKELDLTYFANTNLSLSNCNRNHKCFHNGNKDSRAIKLLNNLADSMALLLLTSNFDRIPDRDQMSCLQQSGATSTRTTSDHK